MSHLFPTAENWTFLNYISVIFKKEESFEIGKQRPESESEYVEENDGSEYSTICICILCSTITMYSKAYYKISFLYGIFLNSISRSL